MVELTGTADRDRLFGANGSGMVTGPAGSRDIVEDSSIRIELRGVSAAEVTEDIFLFV